MSELAQQMFRVGQIQSRSPESMTVRVAFDELDGMVSEPMQILSPLSGNAKHYYLPDEGEHVLCLFLGNGLQEGFVLGSFYTAGNMPPEKNGDLLSTKTIRNDYAVFDRKNGKGSLYSKSGIDLDSQKVEYLIVDGSITIQNGNVTITGGDVTADGVSLKNHTHEGVHGTTSKAQ